VEREDGVEMERPRDDFESEDGIRKLKLKAKFLILVSCFEVWGSSL